MHTVSLDTMVNKGLFFFGLFCRFLLDFIIYYLKKSVYILLSLIIFQIVIFGEQVIISLLSECHNMHVSVKV